MNEQSKKRRDRLLDALRGFFVERKRDTRKRRGPPGELWLWEEGDAARERRDAPKES